MERLEVNPAKLANAATAITAAADEIESLLDTLAEEVAKLRGQWAGEAQQAFDSAHQTIRDRFDGRTGQAKAISKALSELAGNYSKADMTGMRALGPE